MIPTGREAIPNLIGNLRKDLRYALGMIVADGDLARAGAMFNDYCCQPPPSAL